MKIKVLSKWLLLALFVSVGFVCNAQKRLIPTEVKKYSLQVGDTIIFKFQYPEVSIQPKYYGYKTDYSNLEYYLEGYMSNRYQSVKRKKDNYGGYVYHGDYSDGGYLSFRTPLADIDSKELIVLSTDRFRNNLTSYDYDTYHEVRLRNTAFNDTLIFRCVEYDSKTTKPTTILVPKLERILKKHLVGTKFYCLISNGGEERETDRIVLSEYGTAMRYREYMITNCTIYYEGKYWIPNNGLSGVATPHIIIWYQDKDGNDYVFDDYKTSDNNSFLTYSKEKLDAMEIEWREKRKNVGYYYFALTKVDKPQSQNVRKGKITDNNIYEDNIISIKWTEERQIFNFMLKNLTGNSMKIIWDEALIVNFDGFTERVLHKGADMDALKQAQQPAIIPSLAQIQDYFWSERYYGGKRLVYGYGGGNYNENTDGKQMRLILPVQVGSAKYTYTFTFTIKWKWSYPELREQ